MTAPTKATWDATSAEHVADQGLDLARIAVHLTALTGHAQGTFEHESMLGRVLADLSGPRERAYVRSDATRLFTYLLTREEFLQ